MLNRYKTRFTRENVLLGLSESRDRKNKQNTGNGQKERCVLSSRWLSHGERCAKDFIYVKTRRPSSTIYRCSARYKREKKTKIIKHARRSGFAANCLHARVEFRRSRRNCCSERSSRRLIITMQTMPTTGKPRFPPRVQRHGYEAFRRQLVLLLVLFNSGRGLSLCECIARKWNEESKTRAKNNRGEGRIGGRSRRDSSAAVRLVHKCQA